MKTISLVIDTREVLPLEFPAVRTCSVRREALNVGDYACQYSDGTWDAVVWERKSVADLFGSYTNNYENERDKILRAKEKGKKFFLAIEAPAKELLKGYSYTKGGVVYTSKKSGIAMLRQLMSVMRKYDIRMFMCSDREEMALLIQEYYLSGLRI
jgi:ERCC4-type nuclease